MALIDFSTAGLPGSGDTNAGSGGLDTSSRTNEVDLEVYGQNEDYPDGGNYGGTQIGGYDGYGTSSDTGGTIMTPGLEGGPASNPVAWWLAIAVVFVVTMYFFKRDEEKKTGIISDIFLHTLEVLIGITFLKMFFGTYKISGLSQVIEAA